MSFFAIFFFICKFSIKTNIENIKFSELPLALHLCKPWPIEVVHIKVHKHLAIYLNMNEENNISDYLFQVFGS